MATFSLLPRAEQVGLSESEPERAAAPVQIASAVECAWDCGSDSGVDRLGSGVPPWVVGPDDCFFTNRDLG